MKTKIKIPKAFPVRPLRPGQSATDRVTCGTCGVSWDDAIGTSLTPAPSGRCPFEYFHEETKPKQKRTATNMTTTNDSQMSHTLTLHTGERKASIVLYDERGECVAVVNENYRGIHRAAEIAAAIVKATDCMELLRRGLECGIFDDAPVYKHDVETLLEGDK